MAEPDQISALAYPTTVKFRIFGLHTAPTTVKMRISLALYRSFPNDRNNADFRQF